MLNKVILIGNVGKDAEVKRLESGVCVAKFSLATTKSYKDKDGEWQNDTQWHNIVVWRQLAELCENRVKKGAKIYAEGELVYRKYANKEGVDVYATEIVVDTIKFLDGNKDKSDAVEPKKTPVAEKPQAQAADASTQDGEDGLPF